MKREYIIRAKVTEEREYSVFAKNKREARANFHQNERDLLCCDDATNERILTIEGA